MALLGIDLGTSSVKVCILEPDGRSHAPGKAGYEVRSPQPGWAESEPEAWWLATVSAIRSALDQVPGTRISAIGLAGQMHGVVPTDNVGRPTRPAMLWADTRAELELQRFQALSPAQLEQLANPLVPGMAGPLLCWLAVHEPAAYAAMRYALQPKDWLRFRLTGLFNAEASDASGTLLYDLHADQWADDVIAALQLRRELFAPLLPSAARVGTLSNAAAEATGLPAGIPVAAGAADTAAACLGTGLLSPGPIQLTLGTGAQLVQLVPEPLADPGRRTHLYRAADGVNWYRMAAVQNAGLVLEWVHRTLKAEWDELYASAGSIEPGSGGISFLPYLTRERAHHRNPDSRGAFLGLRIDHQREQMLHAVLEGVACGIRAALEALPDAQSVTELRLAGGGSVHPAWRQMLANVLDKRLVTVDIMDASARGAALLAGIADGVWFEAAATASVAADMEVVAIPDPERVLMYAEVYGQHQRLAEGAGAAG